MSSPEARRVLLVGAGGHGRVVLDALHDLGVTVVGAVDLDGVDRGRFGVPILGRQDDAEAIADEAGADALVVAVGDNPARRRITERLLAAGRRLDAVVGRGAVISGSVDVGPGAQLLQASVVNAGTRIGTATIVNTNASVDHDGALGDFVHVAPGAVLGGEVVVGAGTLVGLGARVLPRVRIGAGCTVGAGAVVVDDVPDGQTVVGVPARPLG